MNLPVPIYSKMQIGVISSRSRLDDILDHCKTQYEDYILYVEALKVSSTKPNVTKSVFLILTQNGLATIRRTKDSGMGKVTHYSYVQIESAGKYKPENAQPGSGMSGTFTIAVNFYNKDLDASKKKIIRFTCEERDDKDEEEKNFGSDGDIPRRASAKSNVNLKIGQDKVGKKRD